MFDTNRKISNHSHAPTEVSQHDVLALIDPSASVVSVPKRFLASWVRIESRSPQISVQLLLRGGHNTQVDDSVVSLVAVDVVNHSGLLAVVHKVRNAMSKIFSPTDIEIPISAVRYSSSSLAYVIRTARIFVGKDARIWVVGEKIVNAIRNGFKCFSHIAPPCGLVRGLTAPTVSTPILPQGATS